MFSTLITSSHYSHSRFNMTRTIIQIIAALTTVTVVVLGDNYIFETTELNDFAIIPTLSNGHLGYVAYSDALHMNGLYNGKTGESHRARIPNYGRVQFEYCGVFSNGDNSCTYALDMRRGVFQTTSSYSRLNPTTQQTTQYSVELLTFPHRYYVHTILNQLTVRRPVTIQGEHALVRLFASPGTNSVDLNITSEVRGTVNGKGYYLYGLETLEVEDSRYQPQTRTVYVITENVPEYVELPIGVAEITFTWVTSVGSNLVDVNAEFELVTRTPSNQLLQSHVTEWEQFWQTNGITVTGDDELAKSLHSSLFFLSSALPSLNRWRLTDTSFYGLSPSGLGRGGVVHREYQGHSFWDTEIWMFPPVLLLEPKWSESLLNYRHKVRQAAADRATETGYKGLRFPWESGYTGTETTPDCCPQNPMFQQHIIGDVAFAVKSHFFATHDMEWLKTVGCELAYKTAEFWESRVTYNKTSDLYDIIGKLLKILPII